MEIKIEDLKSIIQRRTASIKNQRELADEMNKFYNGEEVIAILCFKRCCNVCN